MKHRSCLLAASLILTTFVLTGSVFAKGQNLVENGDFENPDDPFKGWCIDFKWEGNSNHMNNERSFTIVKKDGMKKNVMRMGSDAKEPLFMSPLVKYTFGKRYRISFDCRGTENGEGLRVYIRGFKWKPGVRPFDKPHWSDLRLCYRQGTTIACDGRKQQSKTEIYSRVKNSWNRVTLEFPPEKKGSDMSDLKKNTAFKPMRFFCLYGVYAGGYFPVHTSEFLIDNLVVEEIN